VSSTNVPDDQCSRHDLVAGAHTSYIAVLGDFYENAPEQSATIPLLKRALILKIETFADPPTKFITSRVIRN
jgi:hypothetical protein